MVKKMNKLKNAVETNKTQLEKDIFKITGKHVVISICIHDIPLTMLNAPDCFYEINQNQPDNVSVYRVWSPSVNITFFSEHFKLPNQ